MADPTLKIALKRALKNDLEIMRALISIMYRQQPGAGEMSFDATQELLKAASTETSKILSVL